MNTESSLIQFLASTINQSVMRSDIVPIGDDASVFHSSPSMCVTTDHFVEGIHFPHDWFPDSIAHRLFMANLSDIASMGAIPERYFLNLTLPYLSQDWIEPFTYSLAKLSAQFNICLSGGNVSKGPFNLGITMLGTFKENQKPIQRKQANINDHIYVTGFPGMSAIGLQTILKNNNKESLTKLLTDDPIVYFAYPIVPLSFAQSIAPYISSMTDISDGLLFNIQDLPQSNQQIELQENTLPFYSQYEKRLLEASDDYQLCFTASPTEENRLKNLATLHKITLTSIGAIRAKDQDNQKDFPTKPVGYRHFN